MASRSQAPASECLRVRVLLRECILTERLHGTQTFAAAGLTAADLAGFFLLLNELLDVFGRIKFHYDVLRREFSDIEQFLALMEARPAVVSGPQALEPAQVEGAIEFKDVRFSYPSRPGEQVIMYCYNQ